MKRIILFCIFLFVVFAGFSQNVPTDIQQTLDELQVQIKLGLDSIRTNPRLGDWGANSLLSERLLPEQRMRADSLGLNLHWGMVYDESMRERLVQLLNNEFREDEVETLVNRAMSRITTFDQRAMLAMGVIDTREFRQVQDSLNRHRNRAVREDLYQYPEVFRYLQYDTLAVFRQTMDSLIKQRREDLRIQYLNRQAPIRTIAITCGLIDDERFIEPLKNVLNIPDIDRRIFDDVRDALVRMKVEPYYSEFVEEYTFSMEEVKEMEFAFHLGDYVNLLRTQASFRELSKFLHSDAYTVYTSEGPGGNASQAALRLIHRNIENEDLQLLINTQKRDILKIFDWMQENYGNYKIKRVW
jgi:hypothetical protein